MKDKKMHMGPWRKHKYMQAKWFGTCERKSVSPVSETEENMFPVAKQRVSMLNYGLFGAGIGRPTVVAVV